MKAPSVSGAQDYQQLCTAAHNEEHCLTDLAKRQQYITEDSVSDSMGHHPQKLYLYMRNLRKIGIGALLTTSNQLYPKMMIFRHANATYVDKLDTSHILAAYARERVYQRQRKSLRTRIHPVQ